MIHNWDKIAFELLLTIMCLARHSRDALETCPYPAPGERCVQSWSELWVGQRPFPGIRLRIVFAGDRLFGLFGAHPQQPKKESPGPRRPVVLLAVRAVTESAESQSETTSTPESLEGH
jgi:hypothetical protein